MQTRVRAHACARLQGHLDADTRARKLGVFRHLMEREFTQGCAESPACAAGSCSYSQHTPTGLLCPPCLIVIVSTLGNITHRQSQSAGSCLSSLPFSVSFVHHPHFASTRRAALFPNVDFCAQFMLVRILAISRAKEPASFFATASEAS
eukprot:4262534-Pleurochrysis_carterae.AAC.2